METPSAPPRSPIWICASLAGLMLLTSVSSAHAQTNGDERTAAARELFREGITFVREENWEHAAARFQRAYELRPTAQIAYNLAAAWERLGRLVRASEMLKAVEQDRFAPTDMREAAQERREAIANRIGHLRIVVGGVLGTHRVYLDQRPFDRELLGVNLPTDPGSHVVSVRDGSDELESRTVDLAEGATEEVRLDLAPNITPAPEIEATQAESPYVSSAPPIDGDPELYERWWFWTAVAVVVAGAVTTGIVVSESGGRDPFDGSLGSMEGP